ncbi:hybrid sensor histidine kinase/response regulator [Pelomonas sp. UHG3]|jgi:signal transduction histidine kinase|uniref:Hybrid sensor histidine kinase/response regulator n=1 Tax=Roseateles hydrophilus TaxID=2975054 RepID=A0ACC6C7J5_9BURK|nr:hybrid sensor histidine kinase/response regulator [Pelomonas sp. UHG3]MCY4744403.1 hybrid sensor histidine kinase/response regulator [Pelomonas sp. UHG3]
MPLILVVDDQPSNIHALYQLLVDDCEVSMATSGAEALAFCAQQLPDLILLDVLMPEMSGYEVCDRLKADPRTRGIPIIFVTVQGSADDEAEGFAHGAVDYIPKPFVDVVVKARVRTQLALKLASESFARSQIELFQRDKLASVGRTIAGIAQELSSPLGNALISACTLQDDVAQLASQVQANQVRRSDLDKHLRVSEESVGLVLSNLQRALSIVDSFLQSTADNFGDQRRSFSLLELLHEVVAGLAPSLEAHQVRCELDVGDDLHLLSFRGALAKVLTTLIQNAVKHAYREAGGQVHLRVRPQGTDQLVITVQDHGIGMPPGVLGRVFDPFFSTRFGAQRSEPGLYIVRNLVTFALGGQIQVESTPGVGTTARLLLPMISPESRRQPS